jgi:hypothetical protein
MVKVKVFGKTNIRGRKCRETGEDRSTEELHNMYTSPNIIRVIKSRRMR